MSQKKVGGSWQSAQVVKRLLSKLEALSPNPDTTKQHILFIYLLHFMVQYLFQNLKQK
jgi:hypothetical protein